MSDWSKPAMWTMGLLKPDYWQAKWIKPEGDGTSPWLRKEFTLAAVPERAMAFVNVKGYCELVSEREECERRRASRRPCRCTRSVRFITPTTSASTFDPEPNCVGLWLGLGLVFRGDIGATSPGAT